MRRKLNFGEKGEDIVKSESVGRVRDRIVTLENLQPTLNESPKSTAAALPPELETHCASNAQNVRVDPWI